jgi:hypothetical protein
LLPLPADSSAVTWLEPPFFKMRTTTKIGWMIRAVIFVAVYLGFASLLYSGGGGDRRALSISISEIVLLSALISIIFFVATELPYYQRIVTLTEHEISCLPQPMLGAGVQGLAILLGMQQWNKREIKHVQLLRPKEPGNRFAFGIMIVKPKYAASRQMAVPTSVSLEDVAARIQSMGLPVQLSGWNPAPESNQASKS